MQYLLDVGVKGSASLPVGGTHRGAGHVLEGLHSAIGTAPFSCKFRMIKVHVNESVFFSVRVLHRKD